MTKGIIDGKVYNTETASYIGPIGSGAGFSFPDFGYWTADLYRTPKGNFFMVGEGGARSPFAVAYGQNGWSASEGLRALTPQEALGYAEAHISEDVIFEFFGDHLEEA